MMGCGVWASLFSGGKDSSWALHRALVTDRDVARLVTVHPDTGSFLYHVPATRVAPLAAESIGIPLLEVESGDPGDSADSSVRGDRELAPLEEAIRDLADRVDLVGVTAGAVESEYQTDRLRGMCDRLGLELFAPLWRRDPSAVARSMIEAGFEIRIVAVAAAGLDESWLGRRLDHAALRDLEALNRDHGVHVLGEGGEYETLVTDGPHMSRPIVLDTDPTWDGTRGELHLLDARLG